MFSFSFSFSRYVVIRQRSSLCSKNNRGMDNKKKTDNFVYFYQIYIIYLKYSPSTDDGRL